MRSRPHCWIDRIEVLGAEIATEDRRHLAQLRAQLDATREVIDGSRRCIEETVAAIAKLDRMLGTTRSR